MMKDKTKLKIPFNFSYTELTAIEEYLEQNDLNGMHLTGIENGKFIFDLQQPERRYRYCAEIFKGDCFVKEFISACEKDGWELVGVYRDELYIFRTMYSYAPDITTDDNQKIRTAVKREMLNPGFYGCGFYFVYKTIDLFLLRTKLDSLILANYVDSLSWLFLAFYTTRLTVKLIDVLSWYIKGKKCVNNGEKIPFINLKESRQNARIDQIMLIVLTVVGFAVSIFFGLGYVEMGWLAWLFGGVLLVEIFGLIYFKEKIETNNTKKMLRHIIAVVCVVVVVLTAWSTALYSERRYAENYSNRLENVLDEWHTEATAFAQHYWVQESVEISESDDIDIIWYEVFVSDIQGLRGQYIKKLHKKFDKYDKRIAKLKNHRWDEAYAEVNEEGKAIGGYALKDDKVIYVDDCYGVGIENSLDIIYEKLFDEKK